MRVFGVLGVALALGLACGGPPPAVVEAPPAPAPEQPSFDCAKASTDVERLICATPGLARADRELAEAWDALVKRYPEEKPWLLEGQRTFLDQRDASPERLADDYATRTAWLRLALKTPRGDASNPTGTWTDRRSILMFAQQPDGGTEFALEAIREISPDNLHIGDAGGQVAFEAKRATWTEGACGFTFVVGDETLALTQTGSDFDCGFGYGVYADGTYTRVSRLSPDLTYFQR